MAQHPRHGNASRSGLGNMTESRPLKDQGPGVQEPVQAEASQERRVDGTLAPGARTTPSKGGKAKKHRHTLSHDSAIKEALAAPEFRSFLGRGNAFRKGIIRHLARDVGGGVADPLTCAIAAIAADQVAASRFFFARAAQGVDRKDFETASRLGDSARQNLIAARDICELGARSRPRESEDPGAAIGRIHESERRARELRGKESP
jgi:hypothetical protein